MADDGPHTFVGNDLFRHFLGRLGVILVVVDINRDTGAIDTSGVIDDFDVKLNTLADGASNAGV